MKQNFTTTTFNDKSFDVIISFKGDDVNIATMLYRNMCKIIINENLFDPFFSMEIEYIDDQHAFEKGSNNEELRKTYKKLTSLGYRFRGDGYDIVNVSIIPHDNVIPNQFKNILNFNCRVCVVDTFRTYNPEINQYTKTLVLEDYAKHLLSERQSLYTTKQDIKYSAHRSNNSRQLLTGVAIKEILSRELGDIHINNDAWDIGNVPIFYSASANEKCIDTLINILKAHNSIATHINDVCFLDHDIGNDTWSLVSLANMYKNAVKQSNLAGSLHLDKIYLNPTTETNPSKTSKYTVKDSLVDKQASLAISYDFKDLQRDDATNLNSHIVYNYNTSDKSFFVDCVNGNISNFRDYFYANYTKKMIGKNNNAYPNIPLTKHKTGYGTFTNVFNLYDTANLSFGRNKILSIATLLNNGIEITTLGSTMRRPGLFVSVDSYTSGSSNDFNDKIYGEYLIVSSTHIFEGNKYHTNIVCTKPYTYNKPENEPKELING